MSSKLSSGPGHDPRSPAQPPDPATLWLIAVRDRRDRAAFSRLFAHFVPRLRAMLARTGCTGAVAEDVLQEVMLKLWHKAGQRMREALARLSPNQRRMIEAAYLAERTHADISAETGLPLGTVKSRIRLALGRLRHELKDLRDR